MQENSVGSKTLGQPRNLITNETLAAVSPFWSKSTELLSNKLWLPRIPNNKIVLSHTRTRQNKWFSFSGIKTNMSQRQNNPLHGTLIERITSFVNKSEDSKRVKTRQINTNKIAAGKCTRIRLYPNKEEREKLRKWIGSARWTYNKCLYGITKGNIKRTKKDLRENFLNAVAFSTTPELKWVLETPYDIRNQAMDDLLKAYNSTFSSGVKGFTMRYRSKKDRQQSITIESKHWGRIKGEYSFLWKIKSSRLIPTTLGYDSRLVMNRLGEFYLCIPRPLELRTESQGPFIVSEEQRKTRLVSLDPGVRTFMTCYSPDGYVASWGSGDIARIYRLCHAYDKLQSKRDTVHGKKYKRFRYKLRRCMLRIQKKIRNLVDDCHRKLAKWLCSNHRIVILPEFQTKRMIGRGLRNIQSKVSRAMCTWSHYRFRQYLLHKVKEYPHCKVIICSEEYTSKTCGSCGTVNDKLGGSKTFKCKSCPFILDRDLNGARNILLRFLTVNDLI